jgi:ectoine hydroxylase-related dioxygenase (phytanoyl-CoA dioxygenase family)
MDNETAVLVTPSREGQFELEDTVNWLRYLDSHGYVVIKNVASKEDCIQADSLFWDFVESLPRNEDLQNRRNDPSTWENKRWFPSTDYGLANGYGFGQSKFLWHTRLLPKVEMAFNNIWGLDKQLLVSYDGGNAFRPFRQNPSWKTKGGWWHVDQNATHDAGRGKVCIQGLVSYTNADESTGGLCVIDGSHYFHNELCERVKEARLMGPDASDFLMVPVEDPVLSSGNKIMICCSAGDLVLWDSRTVHCNHPALDNAKDSEQPADKLLRLVGYVCMTPAEWASSEVLEKRRQAFIHNESSSHCKFHIYMLHFSEVDCYYGRAPSVL